MNNSTKQPNKFLAPIVIAGVTIGFLASAYKFVFAKAEPQKPIEQEQDKPEKATEN